MTKFPGSPDDNYVWGQDIERRLSSVETSSRNLSTLVSSDNARLGSILTSQQTLSAQQAQLASQQTALELAQTGLATAQAGLVDAQNQIQQQVTFLLNQTLSAESSPADFTIKGPYSSAQGDTWIPYNADEDATLTLVIPDSGKLAVQAGGYLSGYSNNYATATSFIGVEVLYQIGTNHSGPFVGDGNLLEVWGSNVSMGQAGSGHLHVWEGFPPGETMTFRCRRGFNVLAGSSGYSATLYFQGTSLFISKVGM